jgi:hypothetical protein
MYNIHKIIKTTVLLAGLFGLVGCGGSCCESDTSLNKGNIPTPKSEIKNLTPDGNVTNNTPVAVATINGNDFNTTVVRPCEKVYFDSNNSTDPDGNVSNMTYSWDQLEGYHLSDDSSFFYKFKDAGSYEIILTVTDEQNLTSTDSVLVKVESSCR